jgi:hypothetical protein
MRIPRPLRVLPLLIGLAVLAVVPAARAAETLVLSCNVCTRVVATGKGLPANQTVRVTLTDVKTGQQLVSPVSVQTDADGAFVKAIPVDLFKHPSVESSVWKSNGSVLVVAAHNTFNAPCKNGKMMPMDHMGMEGMEGHLAFTGSHTTELLGVGVGLVALGGLLLLGGRRLRSAR